MTSIHVIRTLSSTDLMHVSATDLRTAVVFVRSEAANAADERERAWLLEEARLLDGVLDRRDIDRSQILTTGNAPTPRPGGR